MDDLEGYTEDNIHYCSWRNYNSMRKMLQALKDLRENEPTALYLPIHRTREGGEYLVFKNN